MDGENNGKPYEQMYDLGGFPTPIFGSTPISLEHFHPSIKFGPPQVPVHGIDVGLRPRARATFASVRQGYPEKGS